MRRLLAILALALLLGRAGAAAAAPPSATASATPRARATSVPPTATDVPTATATPPPLATSHVTLDPSSAQTGAAATGLPAVPVAITMSDFRPRATLTVGLTRPFTGTGTPPDILQETTVRADADGYAQWTLPIDNQLAGSYLVVVWDQAVTCGSCPNGPGHATAPLTLVVPPSGATGTPGQFCFITCFSMGDWWQASVQGLLGWWSDFTDKGRDDLLTALWSNVLRDVDPTDPQYGIFQSLAGPWTQWGAYVFVTLLIGRLFYEMAAYLKGRLEAWRILFTFLELGLVVTFWHNIQSYEHTWYAFVNQYTQELGTVGIASTRQALAQFTTVTHGDLASMAGWTLGTVIALSLLLVMAYLFGVVVLTRLGGLGLVILTFVMGGLCLPFYALPSTRGVGLWWTRTLLAVSTWSIVYAWLGAAAGKIALNLAASAGPNPDTLTEVATGIMLIAAFNAVPALCRWFWGHATGGTASAVGDARLRLETHLQRHVPVVGGLSLGPRGG